MPADGSTATDRAPATAGDHRLAAELATRTGVMLVELRRRHPLDGADSPAADALRAAGDRLAHEFLAEALAEARPGDAVLSEEAPDDRRRLDAERVWIIDPLDGTRQYGEPGRRDWAVHVALTADPPPLPPVAEAAGRTRRVIASRSRPGPDARSVAAALDAELVALGSVGAKTAAVIRGDVDAYVHSGGQSEWDSAAPVAVALACGLHASRLDGRALRYNRPDVELPDLLICHPELAAAALAAGAAALGTPAS